MDNIREQQLEALETLVEYSKKLVPAVNEVLMELRGNQKDDTKEYLNYTLKGINWFIQVVNGTKSILNEKEVIIQKDEINNAIVNLNSAMETTDDFEVANIIESVILPFIVKVTNKADNLVNE